MRPRTLTHHPLKRAGLLALATVLAAAVPITASADTAYLEFANHGLEPLGPGFVYEGWLIVDGAPVSAGRFMIGADGEPSRSSFAIQVSDISAVSTYVLTIEPNPDADPGPSPVHVLAGDFSGGDAMLAAGHGAALGDDFSSAAGSYILAAPSGGDDADDVNGIWWLDPDGAPDTQPPPHCASLYASAPAFIVQRRCSPVLAHLLRLRRCPGRCRLVSPDRDRG